MTTSANIPMAEEPGGSPAAESSADQAVTKEPLASPEEMFARDLEWTSRVTGIGTIAAGLLLALLPGQLIHLLQLEGASDLGVRLLGLLVAVVGLAIMANSRRRPTRRALGFFAALLGASAPVLLVAPFLLGVTVGWFGWLVLFFSALFLAGGAFAFFLLRDWLTPPPAYVATPKSSSESGSPSPPSPKAETAADPDHALGPSEDPARDSQGQQ